MSEGPSRRPFALPADWLQTEPPVPAALSAWSLLLLTVLAGVLRFYDLTAQ